MYYINNFIFFSFFGYVFETLLYFVTNTNRSSGVLYGPYSIIYGFGIIFVLFVFRYINSIRVNDIIKGLLLFFVSFVVLSLFEFIGGNIAEHVFGVVLWDYSRFDLSFGRYVCLDISISWGLLSIVYVFYIRGFCDKLVNLIPRFFSLFVLFVMFVDFLVTFFHGITS